ncbi:MAG: hypothetical protein E6Q98_24710 [Rhodospirillaceae bacterium]|nr:MAG: hypothetical protein E6Q98_24710 [Rhodospirillaceae bacterium]
MTTRGVAVHALDAAGGAQMTEANDWFRIEGEPVVVIGDLVAAHGEPPHSPPPAMVEGSDWFRVGATAKAAKPVCREGHHASCGHATSGRPWFRIE